MIPLAIVLAFLGAEPGIPPLPSVAPAPRAEAPRLVSPDRVPGTVRRCRRRSRLGHCR